MSALRNLVLGYGKTQGRSTDNKAYLEAVIQELSPGVKPVVVSPSMSGTFSIPVLVAKPGNYY